MKIFIIGAGAAGAVIARYLAKDRKVSNIICADINVKRAKDFLQKSDKISLKKVDASKIDEVAKAAKDVDVIINSALPDFNIKIMNAALKAGTNYQDLASALNKNPFKAEQLEMNEKFEKAGLKALINTGIAPGVSNILAREGADRFDSVERIKIRLLENMQSKEVISSWSPKVAWADAITDAIVYENGKFKKAKPFSGEETYEFPHPFGKIDVSYHLQEEVATLPYFTKTKNVDVKRGGSDAEMSRAIIQLGLLSDKTINIKGKKIKPRELFFKIIPRTPAPTEMIEKIKSGIVIDAQMCIAVEVIGIENKERIANRLFVPFPSLKEIYKKMPGATYISYPAGIATAILTKLIEKAKGVMPPECLDAEARKQFLIELEKNGITVKKEYSILR